jgi:hypothetical protein
VGVTTVVTRSNYRHLREIVAVLTDHGVAAWHPTLVQRHGRARSVSNGAGPLCAPPGALLRPHWSAALGEARKLKMPCFAAGSLDDAGSATHWFAGLGLVA